MVCAICLAEPLNPETVLCCMKIFCADCLKTWTDVRNCCPLCISPIGNLNRNELAKKTQSEFDNGSLMLEAELSSIIQKTNYLRKLYNSKSSIQNSSKSHIKKSSLLYVGEQIAQIDEFLEIAKFAVEENDRVTATQTMQRMTEMLTEIQLILSGDETVFFQDFDYSSEEDGYDRYDMEEEVYVRNEKQKCKNGKNNNKKKQRVM